MQHNDENSNQYTTDSISLSLLPNLITDGMPSAELSRRSKEFWENPQKREEILHNASGNYLVISGNEEAHTYPKSIWIIAKTNEHHLTFDNEMDILQKNKLISSEHETSEFAQMSFQNYATKITLDNTSLTTFIDNDMNKDYFNDELNNYRKHEENFYNQMPQFFLKPYFPENLTIKIFDNIKQLEDSFNHSNQKSDALIGIIFPETIPTNLDDLLALKYDTGKVYLKIENQDIIEKMSITFRSLKNSANIFCIPFLKLNEADKFVECNTDIFKFLKCDAILKLQGESERFDVITHLYNKNLHAGLSNIYKNHLDNNEVILTVCDAYDYPINPDRSDQKLTAHHLQKGAGFRFMQCQADFYLKDAFALGLKDKLNQLITVPDVTIYMPLDNLLEKISLWKIDHVSPTQCFSTTRDNICPAWEYGVFLTNSDEALKNIYSLTRNDAINSTNALLKIKIPSLALFYLLNHYANTQDNRALKNAAELVKKFDLIIPKKFQPQLLTNTFFTSNEICHIGARYHQEYLEQKLARLPAVTRMLQYNVHNTLLNQHPPKKSIDEIKEEENHQAPPIIKTIKIHVTPNTEASPEPPNKKH